ncbi:MAG: BatD family protein [bacterium]
MRTLLFLLLAPLVALAQSPTLEVNVNRDRIYLGESFLLEAKVGGADNPEPPDLSAIRNCAIELLGSQSASQYSITIVNGRMTKTGFTGRRFTYKLTPATEGTITTGPITATVAGTPLTATGPAVTVTGITRQDTVSLAVIASRNTVLVDEPFQIRLSIKIRRLPGQFADVDPLFPADPPHLEADYLNAKEIDGLKGPDYQRLLNERVIQRNQPGFTLNNYTAQTDMFDFSAMMGQQGTPARFKLDRRAITENGKAYWEYGITVPFSPLSEGSYTFGPVIFKGNVPIAVNPAGNATGESIFAVGNAAIVRVIPPPEDTRPPSYSGAIGSNLVAEAVLDAQTCNVGDPLKLTLTLSGAIQMRNLTPPKLSLQTNLLDHFDFYDESVQTVKQDNQRRYSYTLRPRHSGSFELPPVEVSFYDVNARQYRTIRTEPIPLKVRQTAEVTAAQVVGGSTNQTIILHRQEEAAMRPAGMRMDPAIAETTPLLGSPLRLLGIALTGPVVFVLSFLWVLFRRHRPAFLAAQRRRAAFARAKSALKSGTVPDLCLILREYLADRFNTRTESMTPADAKHLLIERGLPPSLAEKFATLMQHHFNAAFETTPANSPVSTMELESLLAEIERHLNAPGEKTGSIEILSLFFILLAVLPATASTSAERTFIRDEAATELGSAQSVKDFLMAAETCQKLVDLGIRNAPLFYNQGTALLMADKPSDAITVLLRAERYGGSAPDIQRNLSIAQAKKDGLKTPVVSWLRMTLFWHYGLDCASRAVLAVAAFSGLWLAWTLFILGARRTAKAMSTLCLILLIAWGSSVLATLQQESRIQRPLLTGTPEAHLTP